MKKFLASLIFIAGLSSSCLFAQNPQAPAGTIVSSTNTKYNNGIGIGFAPSAGSGLVLNIAAGTSFCSGARHTYAGGTINLTASATNYIFLNSSCVISSNTTGYTTNIIPIGTAITGSSTISSITDDRTMFFLGSGSSSVAWGSITGTLSSQTDLQSALNAKAASGANSDITSLSGLTTPLSISQGGTGTVSPALVAGTGISITGSWPDQTITATGGGMVFPGAGVAVSTGTAWATSLTKLGSDTGSPTAGTLGTQGNPSCIDSLGGLSTGVCQTPIAIWISGTMTNSEVIWMSRYVVAYTVPPGCSSSFLHALVGATASTAINLVDITTSTTLCTATFAASGVDATFSGTGGTISIGDVVEVEGPVTADVTLASVGGQFLVTR